MMSLSRSMLPFIGALAALTALAACGDDDESFAPSGKNVVKTVADLPKCVAAREGEVYFVEDDEVSFKCENGEWSYQYSGDKRRGRDSEYDSVTGTLTDQRDNRTYLTVKIGDRIWMAENLKYRDYTLNELAPCYEGKEENCDKYGRLYPLANRLSVCPKGWRLPDSSDFRSLFASAKEVRSPAAMALKAVDGWADYKGESMNGTDDLGFSLLPGGYMYEDSLGNVEYRDEGVGTMLVDNDPLIISVLGGKASFYLAKFVCNQMDVIIHDGIYYGYVRCVKD